MRTPHSHRRVRGEELDDLDLVSIIRSGNLTSPCSLSNVFLSTRFVVSKPRPTPKCEECAPYRLWHRFGAQTKKSYVALLSGANLIPFLPPGLSLPFDQ